jgi:phage recombination protein Bet
MARKIANVEPPLDDPQTGTLEDRFLTPGQREILRKSALCSKLSDEQADYFFEVVERTKLDPFTGQIRPDVRSTKSEDGEGQEQRTPTLLIITTLQGLRVIGDRSGQLAGESPVEWCGVNGEWHDVWLLEEPPTASRVRVFRKDRPDHPQTSVVRWDAMVQEKWDSKSGKKIPNLFWKRMGPHMLGKCALANGYRGAFPNQCGGLYISEELAPSLDPDSEEAIEAEMVRRANSEAEYWKEQAKNGNYPVGQEPKNTARPLQEQVVNPIDRETTPAAAPTLAQDDVQSPPESHWSQFVIKRIKMFSGRTVGDLTPAELKGLEVFLEKAEKAWADIDDDIKAHYEAIKARVTYESQLEELNSQFDFTKKK